MRYTVDRMAGWVDAVELGVLAERALQDGESLELDCTTTSHVYPNGCVPIAANIQAARDRGLDVTFIGEAAYVRTSSLRNPIEASTANLARFEVFSRVWVYFDPDQASALCRALIDRLQRRIVCEAGVIEALNLCLYEALDNVFEHSHAARGFFMAQLHQQSAQLTVCIADTGIGALRSFEGSPYNPPTEFDALTLAVQAGVSRTGDKRGNGLYFLHETAQQNGGRLVLRSGGGELLLADAASSGSNRGRTAFFTESPGFVIDWQVELSRAVSLRSALGLAMPDLRFEEMQDEVGQVVVRISEHEAGTGSRNAASALRVYLTNLLGQGATAVLLDFDGVVVVSASFADEVIGKLAEELGPIEFMRRFQLRNMSDLISGLLDRAIKLRLASTPPQAITRERGRPQAQRTGTQPRVPRRPPGATWTSETPGF